MRKGQVQVGRTYAAKVGGSVLPVTITAEKWTGDKHAGWVGTNARTGRTVRIKSAQRLGGEVGPTPPRGRAPACTQKCTAPAAHGQPAARHSPLRVRRVHTGAWNRPEPHRAVRSRARRRSGRGRGLPTPASSCRELEGDGSYETG